MDIKILRWVFLGLYIAIVIGLLGVAYSGKLPDWLSLLNNLNGKLFWTLFVLALTILSQALFLFEIGKLNFCQPVQKRRLIAPMLIAAFMVTVLVASLFVSFNEFFLGSEDGERTWVKQVVML